MLGELLENNPIKKTEKKNPIITDHRVPVPRITMNPETACFWETDIMTGILVRVYPQGLERKVPPVIQPSLKK